jgi:hypothetical protein
MRFAKTVLLKSVVKNNIKFLKKLNTRNIRFVKYGSFIFRATIFSKAPRHSKRIMKRAILRRRFFSFSNFYYRKLGGLLNYKNISNPIVNIFYNLNVKFGLKLRRPKFYNYAAKTFYINYLLKIIQFINLAPLNNRSKIFNYFSEINFLSRPSIIGKKVISSTRVLKKRGMSVWYNKRGSLKKRNSYVRNL